MWTMMRMSSRRGKVCCIFAVLLTLFLPIRCPAADAGESTPSRAENGENKIQWDSLLGHSMTFLAVQHGFRWAKEKYTRDATLHGPYFRGVGSSIEHLHGWGDGDEFLTNYVGHPMEGAVAGYIFSHNDPKYRQEEFGKNREYWRGKTRAFAFSALYSLQFEIGPISEATVGKIQAYWPQHGLVDWAITPSIGLAWTLAEDSLDKYAVKNLESKIQSPHLRALIRSVSNPARSFANMMMLRYPWHRDTRAGVRECLSTMLEDCTPAAEIIPLPLDPSDPYGRKHASFSFDVPLEFTKFGGLSCVGGGTNVQIPLNSSWNAVFDLSGCKLIGLPSDYSGDSLTYMLGAQWAPKVGRRAIPHFRMMIGGNKIYEERLYSSGAENAPALNSEETYYLDLCPNCAQKWESKGVA
jgi:hypothetical protein